MTRSSVRRATRRWTRRDGVPTQPPERGASAVEFSIIAILLFTVLFGIIDFGWSFSEYLSVRSAAREGARLGIVNGGNGSTPDARRNDLIAQIQNRASQLDATKVEVSIQLENTNGNSTTGDNGDNVVICTRYPMRSLTGFLTPFMSGHLSGKAVMRMEQNANFSTGTSTSPAWNGGACSS